jgi:uracil-DNA glycosylase family 4
MSNSERLVALDVIKSEVQSCAECPLALERTNTVFGEGNPEAEIVFLGEGPGQTEDETGRPFVGRAGKLLDNMIQSMNLKREDVFILNTIKCRPPNNRKPTPVEMDKCGPFLVRQLEVIKPKVIIALGNTALGGLTGKDGGITKRCGVWETSDKFPGIKIMPCYHPSALLRNPNWKVPAWYALAEVVKELG